MPEPRLYKRLITRQDDRVDEICKTDAAAGWVRFDKEYPSGKMKKPIHYGCRCQERYVILDTKGRSIVMDNILVKKAMGYTYDDEQKLFTVVFGHTDREDSDGDVFAKGAYKFKGQLKGKVAMSTYNHGLGLPLGVGEAWVENGDAKWRGSINENHPEGIATKQIIDEMGPDQEFSYRFRPLQMEPRKTSDGRRGIYYKEVDVYETSPVFRGATPDTYIVGLKTRKDLLDSLHGDEAEQEDGQLDEPEAAGDVPDEEPEQSDDDRKQINRILLQARLQEMGEYEWTA